MNMFQILKILKAKPTIIKLQKSFSNMELLDISDQNIRYHSLLYRQLTIQMIDGRLNQSLINGMFNSKSRISMHDASFAISQESRLDPRPTNNPQNLSSSIYVLAQQQLNKFNQCIEGLSKRSDTFIDCVKKMEGMKQHTKNTQILRKKACSNIDVLKQEVISSRTTNSHKLRVQMQTLKSENQKKQVQLKSLESAMKSLSYQNQNIQEKLFKIQGQNHRLEAELVMQTMLAEVEKNVQISNIIEENKSLNSQIQCLTGQIFKSKEQQQSLLDKTRTLEEKLRISQSSQLRSRSGSLYNSTIDPLSPSEIEIAEIVSNFTFFIQNIKNQLNTRNQQSLKHSSIRQDPWVDKYLMNNLNTFTKIIDLLRKIQHKSNSLIIDLSGIPSKNIKQFNLDKKYKVLENQNKNLLQVNKVLKQHLLNKLEDSVSMRKQQVKQVVKQVDEDKLKEVQKKLKKVSMSYLKIKSHLQQYQIKQKQLEFQLNKQRTQRRKLHNEVEDLKGNIRVYCRIRPVTQSESKLAYRIKSDTLYLDAKKKQFKYDAIFGEQSSQQQIFQETKKLIKSAIDGFNVCIFAYGQTGSGKTFTLIGEPQRPGISIRSIEQMFILKKQKKQYMKIQINMCILELYLDNFRDLIGKRDIKNPIQESGINKICFMDECKYVKVQTPEQTLSQFRKRIKDRQSSSTSMNDSSSRSHLILTFMIETESLYSGQKRVSKFSIIDLAGSQSLNKSMLKGSQIQECKSINSSLSSLKSVISGLNNKDSHIPYRNNKLTHFLKDSIGGNAKTLMFVNVSPAQSNQQETFSSLDFACTVKKVERSTTTIQASFQKNTFQQHRRSFSNIGKSIHI